MKLQNFTISVGKGSSYLQTIRRSSVLLYDA